MAYKITVNGTVQDVDVDGDTPLLWVIRDNLGLTGTKFGCGIAACGACTVIMNGVHHRSCSVRIEDAAGSKITTIETLGETDLGKAIQEAWVTEQVPQCGYCQPGMQMEAADFLMNRAPENPTDADIAEGVTNICRCGTYNHIRRAIKRASQA